MEDNICLRAKGKNECIVNGVYCTETTGIALEKAGFSGNGEMIVRIPATCGVQIDCGDQICRVGGYTWYTVVEIGDNRKPGSKLSHRRIVGRR